MYDRETLMNKFRAMRDAGEPIIGGGAGTGLVGQMRRSWRMT